MQKFFEVPLVICFFQSTFLIFLGYEDIEETNIICTGLSNLSGTIVLCGKVSVKCQPSPPPDPRGARRRGTTSLLLVLPQGHPTNLFLTLSVPHRNLAGWQNIRCSNELAGKFFIVRGFGWELLTFLAFQAELAEKLRRLRTTEKKYPFPLPESSDKHLTAGQRDRVCGKNRFCVGYFLRGISKRADVCTCTDRRTFLIYM